MARYFSIFLPFVCLLACSSKQPEQNENTTVDADTIQVANKPAKDSFAHGKIINGITCTNDATQSFALYIPVAQNNAAMPVIYCFDPHGDGTLPLKNYQSLADAFHFILIGSNNSKNGNDWNTSQYIWNTLYTDTKNRLPISDNRIYTCGFSGGAKVAGYIALHQSGIKGVIAAGAGLPENEPAGNISFSYTAMAGRGDMNMTDLITLNSELDKTATVHRLILFNGTHAWPPVEVMRWAFAGLQFDVMQDKLIPKNDSLIQSIAISMNKQIGQNIAAKKWVAAQQVCALAVNLFNKLATPEAEAFTTKEKIITGNAMYKQQLQEEQQLFVAEQNEKQMFQQQFQQGDLQFWTATINGLKTKATAKDAAGAMNQRLLAYLSLAFYSISNNLIQNNQNEAAKYFVSLYKLADASNSEAWYFSAVLNARSNNVEAAQTDLLQAAGFGFTDTARMQQQPEFQTLAAHLNFSLIESKMKRGD